MTQVNINVHHLTRVEGHGNIVLNVNDGKIEELKWIVSESPRFFEVMMRDRYYEDVNHIASRICGICSISHSTVSLQATEKAFGVKPSEQTVLLRKLLFNAEVMESHILHIMFLAAPDFLGVGSVFPLINTHKDIIVMSLRLKRLSYNLAEALAGRKTHPLSCIVGGFAKLPQYSELEDLRKRLEDALIDLATIVDLFKTLKIPDFQRETEYIALKDENEYTFISGQIASSDTGLTPVENYLKVTNEFCVPQSTA
ncbi:MAG: nickel-dependent hydrogenase large subunit, partial [Dehalococcoidales bacterium]|nr:nickel-dependent hydrogenase large subunit [Dehalococcoidales bacterium]